MFEPQLVSNSNRAETSTNVWQVMGEDFELDSRYKVVDYLGAGAYGVVCAVVDEIDNTSYAIKKCKKIFHSRTLAKRTLREIRFLRLINHENIIKIRNVILPSDDSNFDCLYMVCDLMETDLAQIIRSPQSLRDQHVQYFTYQILLSLQYLHEAGIVHRDVKPRNILVNGNCHLKLADFGLARLYNENQSKIIAMTEYVTTRWYRAPEVLVGWNTYSSAVDMWALGCIVGELIGRTPLFPGANSLKQVHLICHLMGKPPDLFIESSRKPIYRQYLRNLVDQEPVSLSSIFRNANPLAIDLITKLLRFDPNDRLCAKNSLRHEYMTPMAGFFRHSRKPNNFTCSPEEFAFEGKKLSYDDLRAELRREVLMHNPEPFQDIELIEAEPVAQIAGQLIDDETSTGIDTVPNKPYQSMHSGSLPLAASNSKNVHQQLAAAEKQWKTTGEIRKQTTKSYPDSYIAEYKASKDGDMNETIERAGQRRGMGIGIHSCMDIAGDKPISPYDVDKQSKSSGCFIM